MKECCQIPKILEAGNRLIKLLSSKYVLPFKKRRSITPTADLVPEAGAMGVEARTVGIELGP